MFNRVVNSDTFRRTGLSEGQAKCCLYTLVVITLLLLLRPSTSITSGEGSMAHVQMSDLVGASIALSELAALEIKKVKEEHKENTKVKGQTKEGVDEPVTVADQRSNSVFINGFRQFFPGILLVSEETDPTEKKIMTDFEPAKLKEDLSLRLSDLVVIVDPLDATKEFTEEYDADGTWMLNYVTTLVCIVENGKPIAGIIDRPFMEQEKPMFGVVPTREVQNLNVLPASGPAKDKVTVSRSHAGDAHDVVKKYFSPKTSLPAGGAGYKSWLVLTGKADAYIHTTKIKTWDLCAGHALILAAGGLVTDRDGADLPYTVDNPAFKNGLVATLDPQKTREYVKQLRENESNELSVDAPP